VDKKVYDKIVKKYKPKEKYMANGLIAFISGGLMGILGQFLMEFYAYIFNIPTKEASTFMIITLIFVGCLFTCLGFFDNWVKKCGAGLIVPITGFAHAMMSAALDYRKEGMVNGLGANMFKLAGSVIVFGVASAYIFGLLRFILFGGNI
jgi:stage V sporulation protein AC